MRPIKRLLLLQAFSAGSLLLAQDTPVMDEMVKPLYFETLSYPLSARLTHVQGVVVVRVKLDNEGRVLFSNSDFRRKTSHS